MESIKKMSHLLQKKRQCILFLNEKNEIASCKGDNLLNNRTEILDTADVETNINLKVATQKRYHYTTPIL